jgi:hypothetical protein
MAVASELTCERNGVRRTYTVWYADDPPEREEAVRFFQSPHRLFPAMNLPPAMHEMALADANDFLREHPIPKLWSLLTVREPISDDDLARLQYLPELEILKIHSNISDHGVEHIRHLKSLETLLIHSDRVSDACLGIVADLTTLRMLDMHASPRVSAAAFTAVTSRLPKLQDSWPPSRVAR